jgi:hypothetical protein
MSKSRKMIVAATLVAAIGAFVAAQALAATTTWSGAGNNDPVFKVSFKKVSGHPSKVKDFASKNLHYTCTANTGQSPFRASTTIHTPIAVHSGSFSRTNSFNSGNIKVSYTISGKFASKTKATGTYKERRALIADPTKHCDSLKEPWTTHKQ